MSIWSSLGKLASAVGSVAGPIVSLANPILGAGITRGSSTLGKMSTDYENKKAVSDANSANLAENQKNRDFNSQEALKQRQFEAEEACGIAPFGAEEDAEPTEPAVLSPPKRLGFRPASRKR